MTTQTNPIDLAAAAIEFLTADIATTTATLSQQETSVPKPTISLADLTAAHQALVARCTELMNAFIAAKNAAEAAYSQNTLLSAQADEAWQLHREQSHLASQLHDQWHSALRERQDLFTEIHKLERMR